MAAIRRRAGARREPLFDATPTLGLDLRPNPRDRAGGPPEERRGKADPPKRRSPIARERRAGDDEGAAAAPVRGRAADERRAPSGRRKRGRGGGGSRRRSGLGRVLYWMAVLGLWAAIAAVATIAWVAARLPPIQSLEVPKRPPGIQILAADGKTLATRGEMGSGGEVPLKELPRYLPQAFIAVEDRRFYEHFGIDPIGITRAIFANLMRRGVSQGGSTLTQQVAKNVFLTQERTFTRKLQEAVLALWLERKFSKAQILELYVNRVYFGAGAYGVEAAAQRYFGKSARQVTLAEAAMLAGLVKSPSRLAPTHNPKGAAKRAEIVLAAMAGARFVTSDAAKVALARPVHTVKRTGGASANYVADWVMEVLDDLIGRVQEDVVVETTINPTLQAAAEAALAEELAQKGEKFAVEQGALVAMTPDGAVRALVGGKSYADSQFNRAVAAKRQPGSAFKPFVYLTALERGLTPDAMRDDRPIDLKGWRPENFGREYFGPVTLTRALAHSLNTVSVRLTLEVGPKSVVQTAHRLGIASKLEPNASIGLGTSEVSPLELTAAFAPFANGGLGIVPHVVTRVRTAGGRTLYRRTSPYLGRIVDVRHVAMMNAMLQETLLTGTARKAELPNWTAAGKTGTSQDFRDAWFIGYTGHMLAGVWLGNDDASPTRKTTGGGLPVEIWSRFMRTAHQGVPLAELPGAGVRAPVPAPTSALAPTPSGVLAGRPVPPAAVGDAGRPAPSEGMSLDRWLIDKLFGRR